MSTQCVELNTWHAHLLVFFVFSVYLNKHLCEYLPLSIATRNFPWWTDMAKLYKRARFDVLFFIHLKTRQLRCPNDKLPRLTNPADVLYSKVSEEGQKGSQSVLCLVIQGRITPWEVVDRDGTTLNFKFEVNRDRCLGPPVKFGHSPPKRGDGRLPLSTFMFKIFFFLAAIRSQSIPLQWVFNKYSTFTCFVSFTLC